MSVGREREDANSVRPAGLEELLEALERRQLELVRLQEMAEREASRRRAEQDRSANERLARLEALRRMTL